jgi:uncharacterized protein YcaQ
MAVTTLQDLRHHAIATNFARSTSLKRAIARLGFVQADPIRAPARAQDLILRNRVTNYRVGDLERRYNSLDLEEDFLYAYGFMPRSTWQLLHPRTQRKLTLTEQRLLAVVGGQRHVHPRELEAHFGKQREVNGWGGHSKATTRSLERLHYLGLLRIAGRDNGVRLYQTHATQYQPLDASHRLEQLVLRLASIFAPSPDASLRAAVRALGYAAPGLSDARAALDQLVLRGDIKALEVDGMRYLLPNGRLHRQPAEDRVRFLAPFDPLVWDRRRFEHLWGWAYRFEAYTPPAKRIYGYYALPMLYRDDVIGWVNISLEQDRLKVRPGFVRGRKPARGRFEEAFDEERRRFAVFMGAR